MSTPRNKNQKAFKKKFLLARESLGAILEFTQLQHRFGEQKAQALPMLWSHCCSPGTRAQHGQVGVADEPSVCWLQLGGQHDFVLRFAACQSPDGNPLKLSLELWKSKTAICTLSPDCTQREWIPISKECWPANYIKVSLCLGSHAWIRHSPLESEITFLTTQSNYIKLLYLKHTCCS